MPAVILCVRPGFVTPPQHTASQFTAYGYRQLTAKVRPSELFVLFRNNHFRCGCASARASLRLILLSSVGFKRGEQVIAEVKSTWCCIDVATMRPARLARDVVSLFLPN